MRKNLFTVWKNCFQKNVIDTSKAPYENSDASIMNPIDSLFVSINFKFQFKLPKTNKLSFDDDFDKLLLEIDIAQKNCFQLHSTSRNILEIGKVMSYIGFATISIKRRTSFFKSLIFFTQSSKEESAHDRDYQQIDFEII